MSTIAINSPGVVYQPTLDRIATFVVGSNGHLYDKFYNGSQWVWEDQGLPAAGVSATGSPGVVYQTKIDRIAAFVIGSNGHLYDKYYNSSLGQWVWEDQGLPAAGVSATGSPGVVYQTSIDRIAVFVIGSNGHLYDKYYNSSLGQWVWEDQGLPASGVSATGSPGVVYQTKSDRIAAFVVGSNGHLYDKYYNSSLGRWVWEDQGLPASGVSATGSPGVVYQTSIDRIAAFVIGSNGHLYDKYYNSSLGQWVWEDQGLPASGVSATGSPGVVYQTSIDRIAAFVVGSNGHLYDKYYNSSLGRWVWEDQGLPASGVSATGSPGVVYQTSIDRIAAFVIGSNGHLYDKYYSSSLGQWVWEDQEEPIPTVPNVPLTTTWKFSDFSAGKVSVSANVLTFSSNGVWRWTANLHDNSTFYGDNYAIGFVFNSLGHGSATSGSLGATLSGPSVDGTVNLGGTDTWLAGNYTLAVNSGATCNLHVAGDIGQLVDGVLHDLEQLAQGFFQALGDGDLIDDPTDVPTGGEEDLRRRLLKRVKINSNIKLDPNPVAASASALVVKAD